MKYEINFIVMIVKSYFPWETTKSTLSDRLRPSSWLACLKKIPNIKNKRTKNAVIISFHTCFCPSSLLDSGLKRDLSLSSEQGKKAELDLEPTAPRGRCVVRSSWDCLSGIGGWIVRRGPCVWVVDNALWEVGYFTCVRTARAELEQPSIYFLFRL